MMPSPQTRQSLGLKPLLNGEPPTLQTARRRLVFGAALFLLCFMVMGYRTVSLGMAGGAVHSTELPRVVVPPLRLTRADIVDRNGEILATSLPSSSLVADPQQIDDPEGLATDLASILKGVSRGSLLAELTKDTSFVYLKHKITPREKWAVNALGEPALAFHYREQRIYPHGRLAAHVLGHMSRFGEGQMGVERFFDGRLSNPSRVLEPLRTSIDIRVQHILTEEMAMAQRTYRAKAAAGVVMDVRTGELVALASLPDFDPNTISGTPGEERKNRVTSEVYELGSPFKTFTLAAALDYGVTSFEGEFDATKPLRAARYIIHDDHPMNDVLTVPEIFAFSSNIGTAQIALAIGRERHQHFLHRLGFLQPAFTDIGEIGSPIVPARWGDISTMTISYGHGLAVTPLQLVRGISAMVNGGRLIDATLVANSGQTVGFEQVIQPRTSRQVRQLLRMAVLKGTGGNAAVRGYRVGGKTGTAEKSVAGGYDEDSLVSSFVGVFPMDDPQFAVFVLLDEPQGMVDAEYMRSGGWTSAIVVKNLIARAAPLLDVEPKKEDKALYSTAAQFIRDRK